MKVNTNIISLKTQEYLRKNNEGMTQAQERLASGKRINSSLDDAAGLAVVTRMNVKSTGLDQQAKTHPWVLTCYKQRIQLLAP